MGAEYLPRAHGTGQPLVRAGMAELGSGSAGLAGTRPRRDRCLPSPCLSDKHFLDHLVVDVGVVVGDVAGGRWLAQNPRRMGPPRWHHTGAILTPAGSPRLGTATLTTSPYRGVGGY
jgi:hypothetical protein